ncbi:MAG: OsmC family peroxiredoxin [Anaerolineae bacterium]
MQEFRRSAEAVWMGDLLKGNGRISSASGALRNVPYTYGMRFENDPGVNPEELLAAAHAACYSQALAHTLAQHGTPPARIDTRAVCTFAPKQGGGGFVITAMHLQVRVSGLHMDAPAFQDIVKEADQGCPVSNLLRNGLAIQIDAALA